MSNKHKEFVFPNPDLGIEEFGRGGAYPGLTLRDYFAAQAIVGWRNSSGTTVEEDAKDAYLLADAMIKAREAKP